MKSKKKPSLQQKKIKAGIHQPRSIWSAIKDQTLLKWAAQLSKVWLPLKIGIHQPQSKLAQLSWVWSELKLLKLLKMLFLKAVLNQAYIFPW